MAAWTLLECVASSSSADFFRSPVDTTTYPDYLTIISHPMDLATMHSKLQSLQYHKLSELEDDFTTMINNARKYNKEESEVFKAAGVLERLFEQRVKETKKSIAMRRDKIRKQSECGTMDSNLDIDTDELVDACVDPSTFESLITH